MSNMEIDDADGHVYNLGIETELRFVIEEGTPDVSLQLLNGFAEILGAELTRNWTYTFSPFRTVTVYSWTGCSLKLNRRVETLELSTDSLIRIPVSIHARLEELRNKAEQENTIGPVSLVVGPTDVGKTSFCHMLLNYAARSGRRPVYVDLDVGQSAVAMPGSICIWPIEKPSDITHGFCKENLVVYPYGHTSPDHNFIFFCQVTKELGEMLLTRMENTDPNTRSSGIIIDSYGWARGNFYGCYTELPALSFEIDFLYVLEDENAYIELKKQMPPSVEVLYVPKQHGVIQRRSRIRAKNREHRNRVWANFYGINGNHDPFEIDIKFSDMSIYTVERPGKNFIPVSFGPHLKKCILGLSFADQMDENLIVTSIKGYVCVTNVDKHREIVTVLSPKPGPLQIKIFILFEMKLKNPNRD